MSACATICKRSRCKSMGSKRRCQNTAVATRITRVVARVLLTYRRTGASPFAFATNDAAREFAARWFYLWLPLVDFVFVAFYALVNDPGPLLWTGSTHREEIRWIGGVLLAAALVWVVSLRGVWADPGKWAWTTPLTVNYAPPACSPILAIRYIPASESRCSLSCLSSAVGRHYASGWFRNFWPSYRHASKRRQWRPHMGPCTCVTVPASGAGFKHWSDFRAT